MVVGVPLSLTKQQVFAMGKELLDGFSTPDFQLKLQELFRDNGVADNVCASHVVGRSELALTVQSRVLPKYGIPGTSEGVTTMREAVLPFMDDWMLKQLQWLIDLKLGYTNVETSIGKALSSYSGNALPTARVLVNLSRDEVLSMTKELLSGFSALEFQLKLQELFQNSSGGHDVPGRMDLALTVQSKVLPKYGIAGTYEGAVAMLEAISPFMDDHMLGQTLVAVDVKLGMVDETFTDALKRFVTRRLRRKSLCELVAEFPVSSTSKQVLSMLTELLRAFSALEFQRDWQEWVRITGLRFSPGSAHWVPGFALEVQSEVLQKYGIPGCLKGIEIMFEVIAPFMEDWRLQQLLSAINKKLDMNAETFAGKVDVEHVVEVPEILTNYGVMRKRRRSSVDASLCQTKTEAETTAGESTTLLQSFPLEKFPLLTKDQALAMGKELLDGFSTTDFQFKLRELLRAQGCADHVSKHPVPGRSTLALTVQSKVLPKYGIPGTPEGIRIMREAISPFVDHWGLQDMLRLIDDKLGVEKLTEIPEIGIEDFKERKAVHAISTDAEVSTDHLPVVGADFPRLLGDQGLQKKMSEFDAKPGKKSDISDCTV
mmetsp:Transcript_157815/g.273918  ORF Transcript_157815/g.273918 Transcript_157815/m.273918 type:complete len:600 (+) Transcript_157815:124-1923(+)